MAITQNSLPTITKVGNKKTTQLAANTFSANTTAPSGAVQVFAAQATGGTSWGSLLYRMSVKCTGTTVAGLLRFFESPDAGTTFYLLPFETAVTAVTGSVTVAGWSAVIDFSTITGTAANSVTQAPPGYLLAAGSSIYAIFAQTGMGVTNFFAEGSDY